MKDNINKIEKKLKGANGSNTDLNESIQKKLDLLKNNKTVNK